MVTYVVLAKFTDQGAKTAKRLPEAGRSVQTNGENVWSDREGHLLDARKARSPARISYKGSVRSVS